MKSIKYWLAGLLLIQIAVIAGMLWDKQQLSEKNQTHNLISIEHNQVDQLVIADADKNTVTLIKSAGNWQLPALDNLPADESKLENLLLKLQALKAGWPAATTSPSQQRFEVSEDKFQRRMQLFQNKTQVDELYVGTSPGFRKVHVRKATDNEIYAVALNTFDLPAKASDWLDKALLSISGIENIKASGYQLSKKENKWTLKQTEITNGSEQPIDPEKADKLINALANLKVEATIDKTAATTPETETLSLKIANANGEWTLNLTQAGDHYTAERSDRKQIFKLSQTNYEQVVNSWQALFTPKASSAAGASANTEK